MAQEDNLGLKPRLRLERRSQHMQQEAEERNHPVEIPDPPVHYRWIGFSAGSAILYRHGPNHFSFEPTRAS
jgi:hypothetical protein